MAIAGVDRPAGERARFLTAAAISGGWRIADVTMDYPPDRDDTDADVEVSLGNGNSAEHGTFRLSKVDERWHLNDPFVTFQFPSVPLWYFDVNGVKVPHEVNDRSALPQRYALFPGVYRLYQDTSDLVDIESGPVTLLPDGRSDVDNPKVTATPKALPPVQRAVDAHIDECAKHTTTANAGCPFGIDPYEDRVRVGDNYLRQIADVRWKVLRYPVVALSDAVDAFAIDAKQPGVVQLSGTGVNRDQQRIPFTTQCYAKVFSLAVGLTAARTMSVVPPARRYGDSAPAMPSEDCASSPS